MRVTPVSLLPWNVPVALALGGGIGFYCCSGTVPPSAAVFLAVPAGLGVIAAAAAVPALRRAGVFLIAMSVAAAGGAAHRIVHDEADAFVTAGQPADGLRGFSGVATGDPYVNPAGRTIFTLKLRSAVGRNGTMTSARGTVTVIGPEDGPRPEFGWGALCTVEAPLDIPAESDPDSGSAAAFPDAGAVRITGWRGPLFRIRYAVRASLSNLLLDRAGGGFFTALFLGDRTDLAPEVTDSFRKAGAVHILALSGMHLAIIALALSTVLTPLLGKTGSFSVSVLVLGWYLFLAGPLPSLIRAGAMYLIAGLARCGHRRLEPAAVPAAAFVLYLASDPAAALTLSFQLSFLAVIGIIVLSRPVQVYLLSILPRPVAGAVSTSVAAQAATAPLVIGVFGVFYPAGLVAGLALGPLVTAFMWGGMTALLAAPFVPSVLPLIDPVLQFLYKAIIVIVTACARFPALPPA